MLTRLGESYEDPNFKNGNIKNQNKLHTLICIDCDWYVVYDFIEEYLNSTEISDADKHCDELNKLLENGKAGYRILKNNDSYIVVPITSNDELQAIKEAEATPYAPVNAHIAKAAELYSDRENPDYENSVKESISAVESICKIITNDKKATLGKALKKLSASNIIIHESMVEAFKKLYGYTNDESGIRHGSLEMSKVQAEDALFMLIACSAFVNYLIAKMQRTEDPQSKE